MESTEREEWVSVSDAPVFLVGGKPITHSRGAGQKSW